MLRFATFGSTFVESYPENNPFDSNPPLWNLSPFPLDAQRHDTQAVRDAACAAANSSGSNPFYGAYGPCPLAIYDSGIYGAKLPPITYAAPSPLERATVHAPLQFLAVISPTGNTLAFKVRIGDDVRLLKVFRDQEVSMVGYRKPEERPPHPLKRFRREKEAYEHLLHSGACEKGLVPQCFGWLELTEEDRDTLLMLPDVPEEWRHIHRDDGLPKALLLEFFDDAEPLTIDNITLKIADSAVRALYHIHASYVLHNDIHGRNVLVLPGQRVVWIDFDSAAVVSRSTEFRPVRRQELLNELVRSWNIFYNRMLMDKRIGFRSPWY
ncbi:hypothetical protein PHLGIDRAFT_162018 [Phlebiopsis gigantea 11061_1 CR5-6]|uniref:Protein kinase domain-containing protein n=1 Tax=Phlebiopsis gigantea (strain 11061_1 CR5-6) TaxID=745531 RepID=A0A0C3S8D7_PHLG1|nr:hypothetical protein PHLGIDRAFT_162018 [Phlebiopsis gigantea 11061_1 CR5-6]